MNKATQARLRAKLARNPTAQEIERLQVKPREYDFYTDDGVVFLGEISNPVYFYQGNTTR